jgi:hypothetical protein
VDLMRWEQKNLPPMPDPPAHPDAGQMTLALAMRLALQDEALWLKPGMGAAETAAVRQQVAAVRQDAQRLWVNAVVARQSLAHSGNVLAVAQVGAELGQRMAQVGNWSRARQIEQELVLWDASARADKARLQADLGESNYLMLRNHGLLTVGKTIADAFLSMYTFENTCRIQVDALAGQSSAADLTAVDPQILNGVATAMRVQTGGLGGAFVWPSLLRKLERESPGYKI